MDDRENAVVVGPDGGGRFTDRRRDRWPSEGTHREGEHRSRAPERQRSRGSGLNRWTIAGERACSASNLVGELSRFINGNTVATNVLAQMSGPELGLLATKGFEDGTRVVRSNRSSTLNNHDQMPGPPLVARRSVVRLTERVERNGTDVVPLYANEVRAASRSNSLNSGRGNRWSATRSLISRADDCSRGGALWCSIRGPSGVTSARWGRRRTGAVTRVANRPVRICGALGISGDALFGRYLAEVRPLRTYDRPTETHGRASAPRVLRNRRATVPAA